MTPNEAVKKPDIHKPAQHLSYCPASSSGFEDSYLQFVANLRDSLSGVCSDWGIPKNQKFNQFLALVGGHIRMVRPTYLSLKAPRTESYRVELLPVRISAFRRQQSRIQQRSEFEGGLHLHVPTRT